MCLLIRLSSLSMGHNWTHQVTWTKTHQHLPSAHMVPEIEPDHLFLSVVE